MLAVYRSNLRFRAAVVNPDERSELPFRTAVDVTSARKHAVTTDTFCLVETAHSGATVLSRNTREPLGLPVRFSRVLLLRATRTRHGSLCIRRVDAV